MKDLPLYLPDPMIRALRAGEKTQLRLPAAGLRFNPLGLLAGDRFWVRETWAPIWPEGCEEGLVYDGERGRPIRSDECDISYRADTGDRYPGGWPDECADDDCCCRWKSPMHMPRWACRYLLIIDSVQLQPLQAIDLPDARLEGIPETWGGARILFGDKFTSRREMHLWDNHTTVENFAWYWDLTQGRRIGCSWEANPDVVRISFRWRGVPGASKASARKAMAAMTGD